MEGMESSPSSKQAQNASGHLSSRRIAWFLIFLNAVGVLLVTILCVWQGRREFQRGKAETEGAFLSMVESFSLFGGGNMMGQQMSVHNWCRYIEQEKLDLGGTLTFLSNVSTASDVHLHLVRADDLKGFCLSPRYHVRGGMPPAEGGQGYREVDYQGLASAFAAILPSIMSRPDEVEVLLASIAPSSSLGVSQGRLAFCGPAMVREGDGGSIYIVMKISSSDDINALWRLPDNFRTARVSLIDKYGDYILQGGGFTGGNFWDFIRTEGNLSFFDIGRLQAEFAAPGASLLELRNSAGESYYYAGCPSGVAGGQTFVLSIRQDAVVESTVSYRLAAIVLAGMLFLFLLDGWYMILVNRKLHESVDKAEKESRFKTEFLSSMSHDIRTPMNAIMGLTKIMRRSWGDEAKMLDCLGKVEVSGRHLLMLINDVLDISKIESDGVILSPSAFSLSSLTDEIQTLTEPQSREKGLAVSFRKEGIDHDLLVADELRIKQVFMNLLSNAIKYTPEGGSVDVCVSESPSSSQNRRQVRYVVRDTGLGMSEDFMKTMYQAFSREVDTRINKIPGTGLGLSIVKQLVDLMGGSIDCQSMVGKGTTFTVDLDLPVAQAVSGKASEDEDWKEDFIKGATLLVAEDNDINWEIERELLSYKGIECERAEDGKICVEMLKAAPVGKYAAILMDMQMPVMDGMTAAREIRALDDSARSAIPIIAVTANAFVDDVRACLDAGMDAHVCKPVNVESVIKALRSVMRRR